MTNMTLSIPDELHKDMKMFPEVRWSEVARRAIEEKVNMLKDIEEIASKSKLTMKDVMEISRRIKKDACRKLREDINR